MFQYRQMFISIKMKRKDIPKENEEKEEFKGINRGGDETN